MCIHVIVPIMSIKNVGIRIRVDKELREVFQAACLAENLAVSDVLREFMRSYADRRAGGMQTNLFDPPVLAQKRQS